MAETLLAFDFGEKRIGVAVGNSLLRHASALKTLHAVTVSERFAAVAAVLEEWHPQRLVVGIPRRADGTAHTMTARCERFANQLHGRFGLPVERVDERYTSVEAESRRRDVHRLARNRGAGDEGGRAAVKHLADIDPLAAEIILQSYFEQQHAEQSNAQSIG